MASLVLVYSLHIKNSPTSYSPFLVSKFLISLDTFLQVLFKYAILYLDDAISLVYPKLYFSISLVVDILFSNISTLMLFTVVFVCPHPYVIFYIFLVVYYVQKSYL